MSWYRFAKQEDTDRIEQSIKETMKNHPFFIHLMREYNISEHDIDNHLNIYFVDFDHKFAEGNGEEIKIDSSLLDEDFLKQNMHYVVHEFFHWLKRRSEAKFYFNDDEEVQAFTLAIAWELLEGNDDNNIREKLYPIVRGHFKNKEKASKLFDSMLRNAHNIILKIENRS